MYVYTQEQLTISLAPGSSPRDRSWRMVCSPALCKRESSKGVLVNIGTIIIIIICNIIIIIIISITSTCIKYSFTLNGSNLPRWSLVLTSPLHSLSTS